MSAKSMLSFTALLLSTLPLFATPDRCRPLNSFEQGYELRQSQMMAAYNAPARIEVRGSWDIYFAGSYIYWQPSEENLELGISNLGSAINGNVVDMNYQFKSGYKAGMGIFSDLDNWDVYAEYTWLSGHDSTRSNGPEGGDVLPFWGQPDNIGSDITNAKARWKFNLNFLDLNLGRSSYIGTRLTFRPYFGARAAWINQKYVVTYTPTATTPYQNRNTTTSWGLGPEMGLDTNWILGYGIRLIGKAEGDLLFTRYNLRNKEQDSDDPTTYAVNLNQRHVCYLRPHLNMELGLGWGTYLNNHNYHFDLSATYNFQIFWNQNMFRYFVDSTDLGKSFTPNGDLFINGATGTARIDF